MNDKLKKFAGALMALAVISSGLGAVSAAPGSIDGTQTDTNTEVYISADKTMDSSFNASGDTTWNLTVQSVPSNADLAMNVSHEGEEYYKFTGAFADYSDGDPDTDGTTTGEYHTFTDDELSQVPMDINQNTTLNVTYWNQSATNPTPTTVQVYVENSDERSVQRLTENASSVDVETTEAAWYNWMGEDKSDATVDSENVEVNGSETDIIYTLSDSVVQDPFANSTEDLSDTGALALMQADVEADEDGVIPVFYKSAPSWYEPADMGTYGVYSPTDNTLTVETEDDEFEDATTADVSVDSRTYGATDIWTVYKLAGGRDGSGFSAVYNAAL